MHTQTGGVIASKLHEGLFGSGYIQESNPRTLLLFGTNDTSINLTELTLSPPYINIKGKPIMHSY